MVSQPDNLWEVIQKNGVIAGHPVRYYQEISSTNDTARRSALEGAEKGTVFIAEHQHKGRGRLGRPWLSPPGSGLYFSIFLIPDLSPSDLPKITMAAGVALCRTLKDFLKKPMLKWPNDLLLNGKKAAGILTETIPRQKADPFVILGIGVNVNKLNKEIPADLKDKITNIETEYGSPLTRGELLEKILHHLDDLLIQAENHGFSLILEEWRTYDACRGKNLTWLTTEGKIVQGLSEGIDDSGLLKIKDRQGKVHEVISGDITLSKVE